MARNGNGGTVTRQRVSGGNGSVKTIDEVKNAKARKRLPELCAEYRALAEDRQAIEEAQKSLKEDIDQLAKSARITKVQGDGWVLMKTTSKRSTIKPERLVEKGVSMEVIEYATVTSESSYYQVRGAKDGS